MKGIMKTLWDESAELSKETLSTHSLLVDHPANDEMESIERPMLNEKVGDDSYTVKKEEENKK